MNELEYLRDICGVQYVARPELRVGVDHELSEADRALLRKIFVAARLHLSPDQVEVIKGHQILPYKLDLFFGGFSGEPNPKMILPSLRDMQDPETGSEKKRTTWELLKRWRMEACLS